VRVSAGSGVGAGAAALTGAPRLDPHTTRTLLGHSLLSEADRPVAGNVLGTADEGPHDEGDRCESPCRDRTALAGRPEGVVMRASRVLAAPVLLAGLVGASAPPAVAQEEWRQPEIAWVNQNIVTTDGGETARLLVKYRCWGEGAHMWGSAKQGPELAPPAKTSSTHAVSWRETPEGPVPTCDGTWQVERVTLQATGDTAGKDALTRGQAWMQFVIFAIDPETFDPETGAGFGRAAVNEWRTVRGNA
jgi:hypothetical protein